MSSYYNDYRRHGLYRSRRGLVLGVCRGIADSFNLSVFWLRVAVIIGFVLTGFLPLVPVYIIAALLMRPEPHWREDYY